MTKSGVGGREETRGDPSDTDNYNGDEVFGIFDDINTVRLKMLLRGSTLRDFIGQENSVHTTMYSTLLEY